MSQPKPQLLCIRGGDTIFACRVEGDRAPELIYFGPATDLSDGLLPPPAPPPWSVGEPVPLSLFPQYGFGFFAEPALLGHPWDGVAETTLKLVRLEALPDRLSLELEDPRIGLRLTLDLELDDNGVLASRASLVNGGERDYALHRLAALCLPLPSWATELRFFDGGVFKEGHMRSAPLSRAKAELITRTGRPGHDWNPYLFACEPSATDERGRVLAVHLAHPGNAALAAERVGELGAQILASEWLAPGEVVLAPGDSYVSPPCLAALSHAGFNGVSARLHPRLRRRLRPSRPVQLNTWEGVYLDVDEPTAMALATEAASLGVERFVLDDGWFTGRATDAAGLGDWRPDPLKFPRGLGPLIGHVKGLGMGFGLWVEPEMVNPDSELYRQHPDWTLAIDGAPRPLWRNQLALDLTREAASDHVLGALRRLLSQHPIEYIKWDCNRALFPAANTAAHQARAFLRILGQLKA
ncbi:MAG: alpha-galactosidase, partial [Chloroflexi bacterium]|nr:alpha-galactosidase [Chloroflexota bacterium]